LKIQRILALTKKEMKKTILMLLLVAMSTGAMVEWEKTLDGSDDAGLQVSPGTAV